MKTPKRTLRSSMRLLVPLAISATLHTGAIAGPNIYKWFQNLEKTPIAQTAPLQEDIVRTQRPKGPNPFLTERETYVSELLFLLKNGKEISLSQFFIKSELIDKNIRAFDAGDKPSSEKYYHGQYQMLVDGAKEYVKGKKFKLKHLHKFFHTTFTRGYDPVQGSIVDMLDSTQGNCNASTQLFSALIEDVLGIKNQKFLVYNDHIASMVGKRKIENTLHRWDSAYQPYDGCGAKLPKGVMVAAYLLANGVEVADLPRSIQKIYMREWTWPKHCNMSPGRSGPGGRSGARKIYPLVNIPSGLDVPDGPVPNKEYIGLETELSLKEVVTYAQIIRATYAFHLDENNTPEKNTIAFEPYSLNGIDWKKMMKHMKELTLQNVLYQYYPREYRARNKLESITSSQVLSLVNSLPEYAGEDLKEKLCSEYSLFVRNSLPKQILLDFPYPFCTQEKEWVKYRYSIGDFAHLSSDPEIAKSLTRGIFPTVESAVLVHLFEYLTPKDFQFFQTEFTKANTDTHRKYAAYGMILSDWKAGCDFISSYSNSLGVLKPNIICCRNSEAIWENALDTSDPESRGLTFLRGAYLSEEEIDSLVAVSQEHCKNRSVTAVLKLSRIMSEYADSLPASSLRKVEFARYASDLVRFVVTNMSDGDKLNGSFVESSPKHASLLRPTLKGDIAVFNILSMLAPVINPKEIPEETINAFKCLLKDPDETPHGRIHVAMLLLDLGIDPLD